MKVHVTHLERNQFAELIGWIGSAAILTGYGLLSTGVISGNSILYYCLSGLGGFGLAVITYRHRAYQSFIVNIVFTIFAVIALIRIIMLA